MIYIIFMIIQVAAIFYFAANNIQNKSILVSNTDNSLITKRRREIVWICFFSTIYLFIIGAFRSASVGYDSGQYQRRFLEISKMSWGTVFDKYSIDNEPLFFWLCKLLSICSKQPQILFIATSIIYAFAMGYFVCNNSKDPAMSFLMLFPMQFYSFLLTGMRQALAFSVVIFFYTIAKKKDKKWIFCIGVFIAFLFHKSSIVALPLIFIPDKDVSSLERILWVIILPYIYIFGAKILNVLKNFLYPDYEIETKAAGTLLTMLMYFAIWGLYALFVRTKKVKEKGENQLERLLMIGCMLQLMVPYQPSFFRVAMFYQLFSLLAVPKIIETQKGTAKGIMILGLIGIMFLLFLGVTYYSCGINPYEFFGE